tara:strand:+ start:7979 stop:8788 length:810 start_codon:yes stop_codon:yes gene_type:complete
MQLKTITGIHGVPRSGTSWLAQIFNASPDVALKFQPLFSYSFKGYISLDSDKDEIDTFFREIYRSNDEFINMKDKKIHYSYPVFKKNESPEHLVFKHIRYHYLIEYILKTNNLVKFILIIRNPLSVLSSWKNAPIEFKRDWDFMQEWEFALNKNQKRKEEYFGYFKWKEATSLFLKLKENNPDRVFIVRYIDLLQDTLKNVKKLFEFSQIPMSSQVERFIVESKSKTIEDKNSVYRLKNSDDIWGDLPKQVIKKIQNDLKNTNLELFLE